MLKNYFLLGIILNFCLIHLSFADEWAEIRARDIARLPEGWSEPVYLGVNNYNGWIDSLHVSDDGQTIYYVFYPGPDLMADTATGNFKGEADIYYSEWPFKEHKPLKKYFMSESPWSACCVQLDGQGNFWYNTNYTGRPGGEAEGNYEWHGLFRNDQLMPFHEKGIEFGDVFYCAAKDELWGVKGSEGIYILENAQANGFKHKPKRAPQPVDEGGQPYLTPDCNTLYFSTNRGDTPSPGPVFYKAERRGDQWSEPEAILWGNVGVGEWTMTADGQKAFFVQLFKDGKGGTRIAAFSTERKGAGGPSRGMQGKELPPPPPPSKIKELPPPPEPSAEPTAVPGESAKVALDGFKGIGGTTDVQQSSAGLVWTYKFDGGEPSMIIMEQPAFANFNGLSLQFEAEKSTTLILIIAESKARYQYLVNLVEGASELSVNFSDFTVAEDAPDTNGHLDINSYLHSFGILDLGGAQGQKGTNKVTVKSVRGL